MRRRHPRRAPRPASGIALCLLLAAGRGGPSAAEGQTTPAATPAAARCQDCDDNGRELCPTCGGQGELTKECRRCGGSGRRPCAQCADPEKASNRDTEPGSIRCTYCGGRGVLGTRTPRVCPQCAGTRVVSCPSCLGKGSVRCKERLYDRICPTCRYAGRIDCRSCSGTKVSPRTALAREKTAAPNGASRSTPASGALVGGDGIEERFRSLAETLERNQPLFEGDLYREAEETRRAAGGLLGRFEQSRGDKNPETLADLEDLRKRIHHLRWRYSEINDLFDDFRRAFSKCERVRGTREQPPREGMKDWPAQWNDLMTLALGAGERRAAQLEKEQPAWLLKEGEDIRREWERLRNQAETELTALAAAGEAARRPIEVPPAGSQAARALVTPPRAADNPPRPPPASGEGTSLLEREAGAGPTPIPELSAAVAGARAPEEAQERSLDASPGMPPEPVESAAPAPGPPPLLAGFFWALGGFCLAALCFIGLGRRRSRGAS